MNCNFFALLQNGDIRKILLTQSITPQIQALFTTAGETFFKNKEIIPYDFQYLLEEDELFVVPYEIPLVFIQAVRSSIGIQELSLESDKIKSLFWFENETFYFQNFDSRKLLSHKQVLFYDENTYSKLETEAFIVDNVIHALLEKNKFYFKSYANAHKILDLSLFYKEASDLELKEFSQQKKISVNQEWLIKHANTVIRKQITGIQTSKILQKIPIETLQKHAMKFNIPFELDNKKKLTFPGNIKICKEILTFLNEQYFFGVLSGEKFKTNSKRKAE